MARYIAAATIMSGRIFVHGLPLHGPWDSSKVVRWAEEAMARVVQELAGDRVIRTEAELRNVLETRAVEAPARKIWIHEDLEDAVRRTLERERYTIKH